MIVLVIRASDVGFLSTVGEFRSRQNGGDGLRLCSGVVRFKIEAMLDLVSERVLVMRCRFDGTPVEASVA